MRNNFNLSRGDGFAMPFFQHFGSTPKLLKLIGCQIFQKCFILFFFVAAFTNFIYGQVDGCNISVLGGGTAFCDPVNVTIDCEMVGINDGCIEINNTTNDCGGSGYTCVDIVFDIQDLIACDVLAPGLNFDSCVNAQFFPVDVILEFSVSNAECISAGDVAIYNDDCVNMVTTVNDYDSEENIQSSDIEMSLLVCSAFNTIAITNLSLSIPVCGVALPNLELLCAPDTTLNCIEDYIVSIPGLSDSLCIGALNFRDFGSTKIEDSFKSIGNDTLILDTMQIQHLVYEGTNLLSGISNCPNAIYEVVYSILDSCDRGAACSQMVMIGLNDPPTIIPPAIFGGEVTCAEDIIVGTATYTTSCGVEGMLTVDMPIVVGEPNCPNTTYTFVHRVTDDCGRIAELEEVFEIVNDAPIILSCPNDTTISNINDLVIGVPVFNIACGDVTVETIGPTLMVEPDCCTTQIYNMIYKITDECERVADCSQMITVLKPRTEINFE